MACVLKRGDGLSKGGWRGEGSDHVWGRLGNHLTGVEGSLAPARGLMEPKRAKGLFTVGSHGKCLSRTLSRPEAFFFFFPLGSIIHSVLDANEAQSRKRVILPGQMGRGTSFVSDMGLKGWIGIV